MKIQEQDIYHGVALSQIVRHESFKALNSGSEKHGHYQINKGVHVLIKYRTNDGDAWNFTFKPNEISAIKKIAKKGDAVFLCLVCGSSTVCALSYDEIQVLLIPNTDEQQSINVESPFNASLRVRGTKGALPHTIPHNAFPKRLFE